MNYKLIDAKFRQDKVSCDLTVNRIPEGLRDYFNSPGVKTYHGKGHEWYEVPSYRRCTDDTLCARLAQLYEVAKHRPEPVSNPNA